MSEIEQLPINIDGLKTRPPRRVVSLVPSITESLFALGFGSSVVGISDYCTEPEGQLDGLQRLGGPKDARLPDILALAPDLVVANQEENDRALIESLRAADMPVWLTFPRSVNQAVEMLWEMVNLYSNLNAGLQVRMLEVSLEWARAAARNMPAWRYFCPIWQSDASDDRWWMTFNRDTYSNDLLAALGGENVFAGRDRRYPLAADLGTQPPEAAGERDTRYPRVTLEEVREAQPDVILLPDEPFPFDENHESELVVLVADTPAVQSGRVIRLDGRLITWYGTRLALALQELPTLFTW